MADKPFVSPRRLKKFLTNLLGEKLDTKEEILANTDVKKFAGAMAVQEMFNDVNDSLGEDEAGMTVHEKLDYIMSSGNGSSQEFILGGNSTNTSGGGGSYISIPNNAKTFSWTKINGSITNARIYTAVETDGGSKVHEFSNVDGGFFGSEYNSNLFRIWGSSFTVKINITY